MLEILLGPLLALTARVDHGLLETAGLYLLKVTAVKVPAGPKSLGDSTLRADEVIVGPRGLKGSVAVYDFFKPRGELRETMGSRYSGKYPDFAYPAPKGQTRYWWATKHGADGWKTANFHTVVKFIPTQVSEFLLKADFKVESKEATQQQDLADALVRLESKRTRIEQIILLRELQQSENKYVSLTAERTLKNLFIPPKKTPSEKK